VMLQRIGPRRDRSESGQRAQKDPLQPCLLHWKKSVDGLGRPIAGSAVHRIGAEPAIDLVRWLLAWLESSLVELLALLVSVERPQHKDIDPDIDHAERLEPSSMVREQEPGKGDDLDTGHDGNKHTSPVRA